MEFRPLGRTGLKVSAICLGTAFRGSPDDAVRRATIERALDLGVNFIDCANAYQSGDSERLLGEVLAGRRDRFIITTKVYSPQGPGPNDGGLSRRHLLQAVEQSLARLRTDYLDLYLLHQPDTDTPMEETLRALDFLVAQGKVRYVGCCNYPAWEVCKALWTSDRRGLTPFCLVQNHYNLLDRSVERELMPLCRSEGLGMMTYSPLAIGLLTGRARCGQPPPAGTPWAQGRAGYEQAMTPAADGVVAELLRIGRERRKTPAQVAIAWLLSHPELSAAMIGPDSPEQVEENVGGTDWSLAPQERAALDAASAWAVGAGFQG
jgi:aryl-alcohol dehydrogenase-like predicted oxidoreductase